MKLLWLLLVIAPAQQLTWYEHFERGQRSFRKQNWQECIDHMDEAIAVKPNAARNQITRAVQKVDYSPYYYKALATYRLGRLDEAVTLARRAAEGEVVRENARMMAELVPIFDEHRKEALATSERYREERVIIETRGKLLDLLSRGDLDRADEALASIADLTPFDDIRRQLGLQRENLRTKTEADRQIIARIEESIGKADKRTAGIFLEEFRTSLDAVTVADLQTRIDALPDLEEETVPLESPVIVENEEEIRKYRQLYEDLGRDLEEREEQVRTLERKNQTLEEMIQDAEQNEAGDTAIPYASALLFVNVVAVGREALQINASAFSPLPLVSWRLTLNGETMPMPAGVVRRDATDDNIYRLEYEIPVHRYGQQTVSLSVVDELKGPAVVETEVVEIGQPLYSKPWPWLMVLAIAVFFVLFLFLRGRRARRLARLRHFNPYIAGSPIRKQDMFFGRDALIRRIQGQVHKNSFMIHGQRRIGKTSLLLQIEKNLGELESREYRFFPVFIDLQGVRESELFHHMMGEVVSRAVSWEIALEDLQYGEDVDSYNARKFARDIKVLITRLDEEHPGHAMIVLLLDEVDCLNDFDEKTNQKLRGIFMKDFADHLTCVMAGIHLKKKWESHGSPWYNFFEEIPVDAISREAAERLIRQPVRGIFRFRDEAVARIIELTGSVPYNIQKICVSLIGEKLEAGHFTIETSDVDAVWQRVQEEIERSA